MAGYRTYARGGSLLRRRGQDGRRGVARSLWVASSADAGGRLSSGSAVEGFRGLWAVTDGAGGEGWGEDNHWHRPVTVLPLAMSL